MAEHFVRIVEDGTLEAEDGWAFITCEDTGAIFFVAEPSAVTDEAKLSEAWVAAKQLVIEQAVREGIVDWRQPPPNSERGPGWRAI